jgi:glycosyltransferase involved in cell wall biosynthesis
MKSGLRIFAWPAFSNKANNPYTNNLYRAMPANHIVRDLYVSAKGLLLALPARADIVHLHWLERPLWARHASMPRKAFYLVNAMVIVWLFKLRGARIVWTVHNIEPHSKAGNADIDAWPLSSLWRVYLRAITAAIDGLVLLSESHLPKIRERFPRLAALPYAVTPHPHYKGAYKNGASGAIARGQLGIEQNSFVFLFVGNISPYKGVEDLIPAFRALDAADARLIVAGNTDNAATETRLRELAGDDRRIILHLGFVPDDRLQFYFNAADVVVLPFRAVTNSGSVLMALSFDRPVAVSAAPVFQELADIVGADWIYNWQGVVDAQSLAATMQWVRATKRTDEAPLESLSWSAAAERTLGFYETLLSGANAGS